MNESLSLSESLDEAAHDRIDPVCESFEAELRREERPRIEKYLAQAAEGDRLPLLKELLLLELAYDKPNSPQAGEKRYHGQFPDKDSQERRVVDQVLKQVYQNQSWPLPSDRYQVVGEIAQGGMGVVLRVVDTDLQRPLAIKVMHGVAAVNGRDQVRFLEEARITAQLQHPGIPPVHEIGRLADGRPFFSMKLIQGRTLAAILKQRPSPDTDLAGLLTIFKQVAQTVAFAHSQGVIHRDLKPSNVMVGAFGEVQVMDWGLAKRLAAPAGSTVVNKPQGSTADSSEDSKSDRGATTAAEETVTMFAVKTPAANLLGEEPLTQPGQIMGTPSYMPPEQARGEIEHSRPQSDVFGLGGILCHILTGKPSYDGRDAHDVFQKAKTGNLAEAMARLDECGADPELLALTKQCLSPNLVDRPADAGVVAQAVSRHLAEAQQRSQQDRLERQRQTLLAMEERRRRKLWTGLAAAVLVAVCLAAAGIIYRQYQHAQQQQQWALAVESLDRAEQNIRKDRYVEATAMLQHAAGRLGSGGPESIRRRLNELRDAIELAKRLEQVRLDRSTFTNAGFDNTTALRQYIQTLTGAGLDIETTSIDTLAQQIRRSMAKSPVLAALDDMALIYEYQREKSIGAAQEKLLEKRNRLLMLAKLADPHPLLRDHIRSPEVWSQIDELQRLADQLDPSKTSPQLLHLMGELLPPQQQISFLREARASHPDDFWLNFDLAFLLQDTAPADSAGYYQAAMALRPNTAAVHINYGVFLHRQKRPDEALASFRRALDLQPDSSFAFTGLGNVRAAQGDIDGAIDHFRRAVKLLPESPIFHANLGRALLDHGETEAAVGRFRRALQIDPGCALAHVNLAACMTKMNDWQSAVKHYRETTRLDTGQFAAQAHRVLCSRFIEQNELSQATDHARQALRAEPQNAKNHNLLGILLGQHRKWDQAIEHYLQAIRLQPDSADYRYNLANAYKNKSERFRTIEEHRLNAIHHYKEALRINPEFVDAHINLAVVLKRNGDLDGAIEQYQNAIRLDPQIGDAHYNLGIALRAKKRYVESIASFQAAIRINPRDAQAYRNLGTVLDRIENHQEALESYQQAVEIDPNYRTAHINLGISLVNQGRFAEGKKHFQRAHELSSAKGRGDSETLSRLQDAEQMMKLAQRLEKVPVGAEPTDIDESLLFAKMCYYKRRFAEAYRFYVRAFELDSKIAGDVQLGHRNLAARIAILAAAELSPSDDSSPQAAKLRKQGYTWLRAELNAWRGLAAKWPALKPQATEQFQKWQIDWNLKTIRDEKALSKLPDDERSAWQSFWSEVNHDSR